MDFFLSLSLVLYRECPEVPSRNKHDKTNILNMLNTVLKSGKILGAYVKLNTGTGQGFWVSVTGYFVKI